MARTIAFRRLEAAPRTRVELERDLARRGVPDEVAAEVLDRFERVGLINDTEYARMWVESRHAGRGLGRRALAQELRRRGVDDDTIAEAIDRVDDDSELAAARALVAKRLPALAGDDPARRTRKLAGMLARRGYGSELTARVLREAIADSEVIAPEGGH